MPSSLPAGVYFKQNAFGYDDNFMDNNSSQLELQEYDDSYYVKIPTQGKFWIHNDILTFQVFNFAYILYFTVQLT